MAGKLIMLFKDKAIDAKSFDHLADVIIFNQYSYSPKGNIDKCIIFEANGEEIQKLVWMTQFTGKDLLYILDRSLDIRYRLKNSAGMLGGEFKYFDIVFVQLDDRLHCIKNTDVTGMKAILRFACHALDQRINPVTGIPEEVEDIVVAATKRQAIEMRETLIQRKGMVCEYCGFDQTAALDLYPKVDKSQRLRPIPMIVWGRLREFADVQAQVQHRSRLLCRNCVVVYNASLIDVF